MAVSFTHCKTNALSLKVMLRMLGAPQKARVQQAHGRRGEVQLWQKGVLECRGKGAKKLHQAITWHPLTPNEQAERITFQLVFSSHAKGAKPVPAAAQEPGETKHPWQISSPLTP